MKDSFHLVQLLLVLIIVGGCLYFFFFSPFFQIQEWKVEGCKSLEKGVVLKTFGQIINSPSRRWWAKNFFLALIFQKNLTTELEKQIPEIQQASLRPPWYADRFFQIMEIVIVEREKIGIWCNVQKETQQPCYFFDPDGYLFKKAPESRGPFLMLVKNETDIHPQLFQKIPDKNLIDALVYFKYAFAQISFPIQQATIYSLNHDIKLKTGEGWDILFDPQEDIKRAFAVFYKLLTDKHLDPTQSLEYVDLRIKNKAYIKRR